MRFISDEHRILSQSTQMMDPSNRPEKFLEAEIDENNRMEKRYGTDR